MAKPQQAGCHLFMAFVNKPYPTYCSEKYAPDIDPENASPLFLSDKEEIPSLIQDLDPPDLRNKVTTILSDFLADSQSEAVALTLLQPASFAVKKMLFMKV